MTQPVINTDPVLVDVDAGGDKQAVVGRLVNRLADAGRTSDGQHAVVGGDDRPADAVIIATDVGVKDKQRFAGKPVVASGVKRAINEPDKMIAEALSAATDPGATRVEGSGVSPAVAAVHTRRVGVLVPGSGAGGLHRLCDRRPSRYRTGVHRGRGGRVRRRRFHRRHRRRSDRWVRRVVDQQNRGAAMVPRPDARGRHPALAMALASTVRPGLVTEPERENGRAAWLLGMSFISEGAIPFAAADPLRVIPSMMFGGAVTGAMIKAFDVTLKAPHGGIFVFFTIGHLLWFLVALAVGTVAAAVAVIAAKQFALFHPNRHMGEEDREKPAVSSISTATL